MKTSFRAAFLPLLLAGVIGLGAGTVSLQAASPTAEQQYWLELINRMRMDPAGELAQLVNFSSPGVWDSPKSDNAHVAAALNFFGVDAATLAAQWSTLNPAPALAWNSALNQSATVYSNRMVTQNQQSHFLDGLNIGQRITAGGYSSQWLEVGENLFATTQNAVHGHSAFAIDWGDGNGGSPGFGNGIQNPPLHRESLMYSLFKEIGIGFQNIPIPGSNTQVTGPYVVTQHFATQYRQQAGSYISDAILTGVFYSDTVLADNFYTPGEGWANQAIYVYDDLTNTLLASGITNSVGGYNIALVGLTDGVTYRVEAPTSGLTGQTFTLNAHDESYGAPVTFYDNVYARFQAVPEPGSLLLCLTPLLFWFGQRRRQA